MGVPGFFRWLVHRYPLIRRNLNDPCHPNFNNLYVDLNGLFYHAAEVSKIKEHKLTASFIDEVFRYLDLIVQICQPDTTLFIAADGPAPLAKVIQQRKRRFSSAKTLQKGSFDRNVFTPGTILMNEIDSALREFISIKKKSDLAWMKPTIYYSSCFEPGEGEHKIMDFIRFQRSKPDYNPNMTHIISSTDADIIFLTLQTHEPYFSILRNSDSSQFKGNVPKFEAHTSSMKSFNDDFELLNISILREYISMDFGVTGEELEKTIDDFIAFSFLVGNDFIPEFSDIIIQHGDLDMIISLYKNLRSSTNSHLIENSQFNLNFEYELLKGISSCSELNERSAFEYLRSRYSHEFSIDASNFIKRISEGIIDAFTWVLQYYRNGCPDWRWHYPFNYSPPLILILPYIKTYVPSFTFRPPIRPLLQQLCVMPPQSAQHLPPSLASLMFPPSPLVDLYPTEFQIDLNNRRNEYQAIILLPPFEFQRISQAYKEKKTLLSQEERSRNRRDTTIIITGSSCENFDVGRPPPLESRILADVDHPPPGIPSFRSLKISYQLSVCGVIAFDFPSKRESLLVTVLPSNGTEDVREIRKLIGSEIFVGYPYLRPAVVRDVEEGPPYDSSDLIASSAMRLERRDRISVAIVEGITRKSYPISLCIPINSEMKVPPRLPEIAPFEGGPVMVLSGERRGWVGVVEGPPKEGVYKVKLSEKTGVAEKVMLEAQRDKWISIRTIATAINSPISLLKHMLSTVLVRKGSEKVNVALTLFTKNHRMVVDGFSRTVFSGREIDQEFAPGTQQLVQEYVKRAGNIPKLLKNFKGKIPTFTIKEVFGVDGREGETELDNLTAWLMENSPAVKHPLVVAEYRGLSQKTVEKIEKIVSEMITVQMKEVEVELPESMLLWPGKERNEARVGRLELGSQARCVARSGPVPFGSRGYVVSINSIKETVKMIFEEELMEGSKLEGKLNSLRGAELYLKDVYPL